MIDWLTLRIPVSESLGPVIYDRILASLGRVTCTGPDGELKWKKNVLDLDHLRSDTPGLFWQAQGNCEGKTMLAIGASPASLEHGINVSSPGYSLTIGGCNATLKTANNQCKVGGNPAICGTWVYDGADAQSGAASATVGMPDAPICPTGKCMGTYNGAQICLACASVSGAQVYTATTKATTGPDGAVSETRLSTLEAGQVTTTTTTTNSTTSSSSTTTTTQDAPGFCEENPDLAICRESSASVNGCESAPACTGDAVQCAILTQQWHVRCDRSSHNDVYDAATSAEGKAADAAALSGGTLDVTNGISMARHLSETCLSDFSVSMFGHTATVPVSAACPYLEWMGTLMVAMSMLAATRIIGGVPA